MPVELITNIRLCIKLGDNMVSYSNISHTATDAQIHEYADAINAMQDEKTKEIYKVVTRKLSNM